VSVRTASAAAVLAAIGAAMLWGTTGTAQALGPDGSDPAAVGAARIALGALVLVLLSGPGWRRAALPTSRGGSAAGHTRPGGGSRQGFLGRLPGPVLVALGGLTVAAYQACFFLGVARTGVAVGTVLALGVAPLATGLLGLGLGERPTRRWMVATAGAIVGVVLLVTGSSPGGQGIDVLGVTAALGAGVAYAGYTIAARALLVRGARGLPVMASFFTLGALLLAPSLLLSDLSWLATASGLLMVAWLGLIATGLSYVLFQHGLARLPAGTVATLSLAEPVTATVLGVLVLREQLSGLTAVGIAVVVLSLSVVAVRRRQRPVAPEPV
jgi:DME family drug/metabolite transporter